MKKRKQFILMCAAVASMSYLSSCSNDASTAENKSNEDPKKEAENHNDAKFQNTGEKDAQFMVDAADINLSEVKLGKLAESKGMSKEVRELGTMMVTDHQKAYDDMAALAKKKNISVPSDASDKSQKDYANLSEKKGSDFDKDYADAMVSGHKDAIDKFEKESKEATDADIQAWATNMLPSLRMHLDHSMNCQEKMKKMNTSMK